VPVRDALDSAMIALVAGGVPTPRLDAELLLAHVLGVDRTALMMDPSRAVQGPAVHAFQNAVRRRAIEREPVAYITGVKGFRRLQLHVDRRVLIPRPETELLVEAALGLEPGTWVHDVGTGSGAVALALKDERPDLRVTASDLSLQALSVAEANANSLGLEVELVQGDLLGSRCPDAVLCNPPYVEEGANLAPEIHRHEPPLALYGGPDGLALIWRLIEQCAEQATPWLALEVGQGQARLVAAMAAERGYTSVEVLPDLAGVERVVVAQR
jgi:release factor glutamine methyltransferase